MSKPLTHSRWVRGLQAGFDRYSQPKGSISRVSNMVYTRRGALKVCDGTSILSAFGGMIPLAWSPLLDPLWRELFYYAPSSGIRTGYYGLYVNPSTPLSGSVGTPALSAAGTGLTGTYYVIVTAVDGIGGESAPSPEVNIALVNQGLHVSWTSVPNSYGYNIYVGTAIGTETLWLPAGSLPAGVGVSSIGATITAVTIDNTWISNPNQVPPTDDTTSQLIFTSVPPGGYSSANVIKVLPAAIGAISTGQSGSALDTSSNPVTTTTQIRPNTAVQGGPRGGVNDFANTTLAYDNNLTTFSLGSDEFLSADAGTEETWSGFSAATGSVTAITLNISSALVVIGGTTHGIASISYSKNGGAGWTEIFNTGAAYTQRTDTVTLPLTQDLTQVKVSGFVRCTSGILMNLDIYEIWAAVTAEVASGGSSGSGGLGTGGGTPNGGVSGICGPLPMIVSLTGKMILALGNGITPYQSDGSSAGTMPITNTFSAIYPDRIASTAYNQGDQIEATIGGVAYVFTATQGGVTSAGGPPTFSAVLGSTVTDGNIIWKNSGQVSGSPAPRGAAHEEVYAGSLWVANTSPTLTSDQLDGPSALRQSDLNNPSSWNPLNAAQIAPDDGDECTGIKAFTVAEAGIAPQNFLMFFKNFSSYLIQGVFGASNFAITRLQTDLGNVAARSLQFIPGYGIMRLSHLGFAVTDGISDKLHDPEAIRPFLFSESTESDITPVDWSQAWFSKAAQTVNPPMYVCAMPLAGAGASLIQTLTGISVSSIANPASTLPTGIYYVQVGLRGPSGVTSLSAIMGPFTIVSGSSVLQILAPAVPAGYYGYRVWFGTSATAPASFIDSDATTINITAPGASGTPPAAIGGLLTRLFCYDLILKSWTVVDLPFAISVLRQFRVVGSPPLTVQAGSYDSAVRQWQAGDEEWDAGAVDPASTSVEWNFTDAEVFAEGGTVHLFHDEVFLRGSGGPSDIEVTVNINGQVERTIAAALTALGNGQYEATSRILQRARNLSLSVAGSGPATVESIDYMVKEKPAGAKVVIS